MITGYSSQGLLDSEHISRFSVKVNCLFIKISHISTAILFSSVKLSTFKGKNKLEKT